MEEIESFRDESKDVIKKEKKEKKQLNRIS